MMAKRTKVCFIIPSVKSGGIEIYLLRFLRYLDNDMDVTVIVRSKKRGDLLKAYKQTGSRLFFKPLGYFSLPKMFWYYQFLKRNKFDTVCDFNSNFAGFPMLLSKLAGIKKRIAFYRQSSHHFKYNKYKILFANFLNNLVLNNATDILSNSEAAFNFFFKGKLKYDQRFRIVKNGIIINEFMLSESKEEIRKRLGLDLNKFIIGHVGRFAEAKNHFFLINVIKDYIKTNEDDVFVLIGRETEKLLPYVIKNNLENNIEIVGQQSDIPSYLNAFDAFIFPSITEGQPNALIEAIISGLPVACSNINAILECLPEGSEHITFNPTSVTDAVKVLENLKLNRSKFIFQKYAQTIFDSERQFLSFYKILLGNE